MGKDPLRDWDSGIFDCFEDPKTCCYGFWCCPCLACTVSNGFGENYCLPLCDGIPVIMASFGIPLCVPPAALSIRSAVRNKHGIKGSLCKDIAVSCFCTWCTWCQMHRELRTLKKTPIIINMQPQAAQMPEIINTGFNPMGYVAGNAGGVLTENGMIYGGMHYGMMNGGMYHGEVNMQSQAVNMQPAPTEMVSRN